MDDDVRDLITAAIRGVGEVEHTSRSVIPHRLPRWTRAQYEDMLLPYNADQMSGARLSLISAARKFSLTVRTGRFIVLDAEASAFPATFAATAAGEPVSIARDAAGPYVRLLDLGGAQRSVDGADIRLDFELGSTDGRPRLVDIWLPHTASVELLDLSADAPLAAAPRPSSARWTHYGSSISQCAEVPSPLDVWPVIAARSLGLELTSLGLGGNAQLDPFAARVMRDSEFDLLSLKVGINVVNYDSMRRRAFIPAMHGFLDTIRDKHPEVPVLIVSPIWSSVHESAAGPSVFDIGARAFRSPRVGDSEVPPGLTLREIRTILADVVDARRLTDPRISYLDGLELFGRDDDADLSDGVHPTTAGYARIGARFSAHPRVRDWIASSSMA